MVLTVRRRAPPPLRALTPATMMRHGGHQMASKCDSELSLPQQRVKYVMVDNPEAVVGSSTAVYTRCPGGSPESSRKSLADIQRF